MTGKQLDLSKSVYELCKDNPELPNLLSEIGFQDITKPGMLSTMGRFMTIPKGSIMKKIDINVIKQSLEEHGYHII